MSISAIAAPTTGTGSGIGTPTSASDVNSNSNSTSISISVDGGCGSSEAVIAPTYTHASHDHDEDDMTISLKDASQSQSQSTSITTTSGTRGGNHPPHDASGESSEEATPTSASSSLPSLPHPIPIPRQLRSTHVHARTSPARTTHLSRSLGAGGTTDITTDRPPGTAVAHAHAHARAPHKATKGTTGTTTSDPKAIGDVTIDMDVHVHVDVGTDTQPQPTHTHAPQLKPQRSRRTASQPITARELSQRPLSHDASTPTHHDNDITPDFVEPLSEVSGSGSTTHFLVRAIRRLSHTRETFLCLICYENLPLDQQYIPIHVSVPVSYGATNKPDDPEEGLRSSCKHTFCRACIAAYITAHTREGVLLNSCPLIGHDGCTFEYSESDVEAVAGPDVFERFTKFKLIKSNKNYRECPNASCQRLQLGSAECPSMTCQACGTTFCFAHANAHPNQTCLEYARATRQTEKAATRTIRSIAKACPKCKAPTEKSGGCNHMTCVHCQHQWCWLCCRAYTPDHYQAMNVMGCPGAQFTNAWCCAHATAALMWIPRLFLLLFVLPLVLAFLLFCSVLWLAVCPLFVCCCCCRGLNMKPIWFLLPIVGAGLGDFQAWQLAAKVVVGTSLLLLIPIQVLWLPVGVVLGITVAIAKRTIGVCRLELSSNSYGEIILVSAMTPTGVWGVILQSLGILGDDDE